MARPSQPRELAEAKGLVKHNPQRYVNEAPKSDIPIGDPPDHMSAHAKACWHEIVSLSLKGVLQGPHRFLLEIASTLMAKFRETPADGIFPANQMTHLRGALAQLCLTPSEQQKLGVAKAKQDDPFAQFFGGDRPQ